MLQIKLHVDNLVDNQIYYKLIKYERYKQDDIVKHILNVINLQLNYLKISFPYNYLFILFNWIF